MSFASEIMLFKTSTQNTLTGQRPQYQLAGLLLVTFLCLTLLAGAQDRVHVKNGDSLKGTIIKETPEKIHLKTSYAGTVEISRTRITNIKYEQLRLTLKNGDQVTGRLLQENDKSMILQTDYSPRLTVQKSQVTSRKSLHPKDDEEQNTSAPPDKPTPEDSSEEKKPQKTDIEEKNGLTNWSGNISAGYAIQSGNSDSEEFYARLNASYKEDFIENHILAEYLYAQSEGERTEDEALLENQINWNLTDRTYLLNINKIGYDNPGNIDVFFEENIGAGYKFIKNDSTVLKGEAGPGYRYEARDGEADEEEITLRLAEIWDHQFTKNLSVHQRLELYPSIENTGEFQAKFDLKTKYKLNDSMDLSVIIQDKYDSDPPDDTKQNDFRIQTTIGHDF